MDGILLKICIAFCIPSNHFFLFVSTKRRKTSIKLSVIFYKAVYFVVWLCFSSACMCVPMCVCVCVSSVLYLPPFFVFVYAVDWSIVIARHIYKPQRSLDERLEMWTKSLKISNNFFSLLHIKRIFFVCVFGVVNGVLQERWLRESTTYDKRCMHHVSAMWPMV